MPPQTSTARQASLLSLLRPYSFLISTLVVLTVLGNALNLWLPKIIAGAIDSFISGHYVLNVFLIEFLAMSLGIFVLGYLQSIVQTYASERVARDLRRDLAETISTKTYAYVEGVTPAKLLTNLTSDINAIKTFVSQAIASIISSVFLIIGASVLLLLINWKLALAVLTIVPLIGVTFFLVLARVRLLFRESQEAIDWLNRVINESILGAALIRLLNSQAIEYNKFLQASTRAKNIGMSILRLFAILIPFITFATNIATLIILLLGGNFVINGSMSLGNFTAFTSYLAILIFPIIIIGFMSNAIAQATASYGRVYEVLGSPEEKHSGSRKADIKGDVTAEHIAVQYGEKSVLQDVSFEAKAGTKTAIIGPTAAGKTLLLYVLIGLQKPQGGTVAYDGVPITEYAQENLHTQVGFVFQDSILFNLSVRENIAFSNTVRDANLEKAISTAELHDFLGTLPDGLDTIVSERGSSLSGGQKQRIMLARALALNPRVLLLDDFTARVDSATEKKILDNVAKNYPHLTLISVTQKIAPIEHYDQILLLMEGEVLARGTHAELVESSSEYVQIFNSQKSTSNYEKEA
jgi:ATP-binding cassette subfamily B protein